MGRSSTTFDQKLSDDDVMLITACLQEKRQLEKQLAELTHKKLAEKFDCSLSTIYRLLRSLR